MNYNDGTCCNIKALTYILDRVFGCHLLTLCQREETTVPKFVQTCVDAVDKRGVLTTFLTFQHFVMCVVSKVSSSIHHMDPTYSVLFVSSGLEVDGIYRVSGNLATIQKLRFLVDQGLFNTNFSYSVSVV